jgi:hypothetical protein
VHLQFNSILTFQSVPKRVPHLWILNPKWLNFVLIRKATKDRVVFNCFSLWR